MIPTTYPRWPTILLKRGFGGGSEIAALYLAIHTCSESSSTAISGLNLFMWSRLRAKIPDIPSTYKGRCARLAGGLRKLFRFLVGHEARKKRHTLLFTCANGSISCRR